MNAVSAGCRRVQLPGDALLQIGDPSHTSVAHADRAHSRAVSTRGSLQFAAAQVVRFAWQQSLSCAFPVVIFASLAVTDAVSLPVLHRYDWMLVICLGTQWWMLRSRLESRAELQVITVFHLIGLTLELFKVHHGSWSYPEEGYSKLFGVPLYSGFMYASVASFLCQSWRRLDVSLERWPPFILVVPLASAIYLNFFWHHYWMDVRWWLTALVLIVFRRSWVTFVVGEVRYRMPLALSFVLTGFFVWLAENIATYFGAWQYPDQAEAWRTVHVGKVSSWLLLVIVSFLIVATLKIVRSHIASDANAGGRSSSHHAASSLMVRTRRH